MGVVSERSIEFPVFVYSIKSVPAGSVQIQKPGSNLSLRPRPCSTKVVIEIRVVGEEIELFDYAIWVEFQGLIGRNDFAVSVRQSGLRRS